MLGRMGNTEHSMRMGMKPPCVSQECMGMWGKRKDVGWRVGRVVTGFLFGSFRRFGNLTS